MADGTPQHPHIERLRIRGFRSLADVTFSPNPGANVLIGANGSGKSNLVHFFKMLSWMLRARRLAEFIGREGGADDQLHGGNDTTPRLDAEVRIRTPSGRNDYRFSLVHAHPDRLMFVDEAFRYTRDEFDSDAPWNPLGEGSASDLRKMWDAEDHAFMRADGGNLAAILHWLEHEDRRRYDTICRDIRRMQPGFDRFEIDQKDGKVALRWRSKDLDKTFGAHLTSDGSLRLFALTTLLNLPGEMLPSVLLLDEPEQGLHHKAIALLGDMIQALSQSRQIIVATQSPLLVDEFALDQVAVLELRDGRIEIERRNGQDLTAWLEDYTVGEIWQKNLLGGRP